MASGGDFDPFSSLNAEDSVETTWIWPSNRSDDIFKTALATLQQIQLKSTITNTKETKTNSETEEKAMKTSWAIPFRASKIENQKNCLCTQSQNRTFESSPSAGYDKSPVLGFQCHSAWSSGRRNPSPIRSSSKWHVCCEAWSDVAWCGARWRWVQSHLLAGQLGRRLKDGVGRCFLPTHSPSTHFFFVNDFLWRSFCSSLLCSLLLATSGRTFLL